MEDDWPFDDPWNLAVITITRVVREGHPILLVSHDFDGDWQFLDGDPVDMDDALVVGLGEMVSRDPSLIDLRDLPVGWKAWRETPEQPWQRRQA